jgi:hypothetical protein
MADRFKHDYVEFDEFGLKEIRCMASGKVIAKRDEKPSKRFPGRTSFKLMKYADYREIPYFMKDGSIAFLMFSDAEKDSVLDDVEIDLVNEQIRRAKIIEMKSNGRTQEFIDAVTTNFENKHIVRRLNSDEITAKLSNISLQ